MANSKPKTIEITEEKLIHILTGHIALQYEVDYFKSNFKEQYNLIPRDNMEGVIKEYRRMAIEELEKIKEELKHHEAL